MNFKIICENRNKYQIPYTMKVFAGGEVQVKLGKLPVDFNNTKNEGYIVIDGLIKSSDMYMEFVMLCDAIHRICQCSIIADLHYLPYARQDRVCSPGEAFALSQFISGLRSVPVRDFMFDDIHSKVANDLFKVNGIDFYNRNQTDLFSNALRGSEVTLVSPDKGSRDKVLDVACYSGGSSVEIYNKVRDPNTGRIESVELLEDIDGINFIKDNDCLILDDICDGGRTFVPIIEDLIVRGAKSVNLCVTHAILPYGIKALKDAGLNKIFYVNKFIDNDLDDMHHVSCIREFIN